MANGGFLFVSVDNPTSRQGKKKPASQRYAKEARQHVMKDIGFARRKVKRSKASNGKDVELKPVDGSRVCSPNAESWKQGTQRPAAVQRTYAPATKPQATETYLEPPSLARNLGSGRQDPFVKYPIELTDRSRLLLDTHDVATIDESAFYQVLSISAIARGMLQKSLEPTELEVSHIPLGGLVFSRQRKLTLRSVNARLGDPVHGNTDGIIASVIGFACHSRQTDDYDSWELHMTALQSIVAARGGPEVLRLESLRLLLFLVDTAGACTRDVRPKFPLPQQILPSVEQLYSRYAVNLEVETQMELWLQCLPARRAIVEIIRDLSVIVQWLEDEAAKDPYFYQPSNLSGLWLVPLTHRCLTLLPHDIDVMAEPGFEMQEILRHAVVLFIQPIRGRFNVNIGLSDTRLRKLKGLLQRHSHVWESFEPLLRWIVVAAGIEANTIEDQLWFAGILASQAPFHNMEEREHMDALRSFICTEDVFHQRFSRFMSQVADIRDSLLFWPVITPDFAACNKDELPNRNLTSF